MNWLQLFTISVTREALTREQERKFLKFVEEDSHFKKYYEGIYILFNTGLRMPMVALHWEKYFQHICTKYNKIYRVQMPKVTPHVCRHTFCSKMAAARMNPKTLQYIMGHSDISVTLNTYTHFGFEEASDEVRRISGD